MSSQKGLTRKDIFAVVNQYIGVEGGYLGDFSYRTHHDFYLEYCDLDINPYDYDGTTRARFIAILSQSDPQTQATILEGVLAKYPVGSSELRTQNRADEIQKMIVRCRSTAVVESPVPSITSEVVDRAIADAETLMQMSGSTSAVDRVHTALHGYLKALCDSEGIGYTKDPSVTELFMLLRQAHPALSDLGPHLQSIGKVLRSLGAVLDALNPARNRGSMAHPTEELLDSVEASLFINAARTILQYLDAKVSR